jgi:mersacidin/lichenicidin family type 2 lantibiotic
MSKNSIIRAWKDPAYRNTLSAAELAALPANPAGAIEIQNSDLGTIAGGRPPISQVCTLTNCTCVFGCPSTVMCTLDC